MTALGQPDSGAFARRTVPAGALALLCGAIALLLVAVGWRAGLHEPLPKPGVWLPFVIAFAAVTLVVRAFAWRGVLVAAAAVTAFLVAGVGVDRMLIALLWVASAIGFGDALARTLRVGAGPRSAYERPATALVLGLTLYAAGYGLALHWPVLGASTVAAVTLVGMLLALPVARTALPAALAAARRVPESRGWPLALATAGALATVVVVGAAAFVPSVAPDDLAYHLRMWAELSVDGRYRFDATHQIWALAPFVVDLFHAVPSVLAREDLRGSLNLLLLLWTAVETGRAVHALGGRVSVALWAAVLLLGAPLLAYSLTSLQTELASAALMARLLGLLACRRDRLDALDLLQVLAIAALLAATKATGMVLGLACLALALTLVWPQRVALLAQFGAAPGRFALAFLPAVFVALHSYAVAWWLSGNPVLPLFNGVFRSPLFPAQNFSNATFAQGLDLGDLWRMFVFSDAYLESGRGVAGFQYLVGVPLVAAAMLHRATRGLMLPLGLATLATGFVFLSAQQYLRYLVPLLPWLTVAMVVGFAAVVQPGSRAAHTGFAVLALLCMTANLWAHPRTAAWLQEGAIRSFGDVGRAGTEGRRVPESKLVDVVNASHGREARVVFGRFRPFAGHLAGTPLFVEWYNLPFETSLLTAADAAAATAALDRAAATHVMWDADVEFPDDMNGQHRERLAAALHRRARAVAAFDRVTLLAWTTQPAQSRTVFSLPEPATVKTGAPIVHPFPAVAAGSLLLVQAQIRCETPGHYVVQLLWQGRPDLRPHFRLVQCRPPGRTATDLVVAPDGITGGALFLNAWGDGSSILVDRLQVDLAVP